MSLTYIAEDVVGSAAGHFFSDDDQYFVYVKYNDTQVPLQSWPFYGDKADVYGQTMRIAYPKVPVTNTMTLNLLLFIFC